MKVSISDHAKHDVVRMIYRLRTGEIKHEPGTAYEEGFFDALTAVGLEVCDGIDLEIELSDLLDSYIEGEWR